MVGGKSGCFFKIGLKIETAGKTAGIFHQILKLLGAHLDDTLSFNLHVSKVVSSSHIILKNVRSIRKFLTSDAAATLIHSIITSKLDQCNSLLFNTYLHLFILFE